MNSPAEVSIMCLRSAIRLIGKQVYRNFEDPAAVRGSEEEQLAMSASGSFGSPTGHGPRGIHALRSVLGSVATSSLVPFAAVLFEKLSGYEAV
jgi:hypothetical protein